MTWGAVVETERRNRIIISLWAYAYEIMHDSLVSDSKFDCVCKEINTQLSTGNDTMDKFFLEEFSPHTGMWIYKHPNIEGIMAIYQRLTGKVARHISKPSQNPLVDIKTTGSPFGTHFENMIWLASLGFRVVPGRFIGKTVFDYWFDKDFMTLKNPETLEEKIVFYKDIFDNLNIYGNR